MTSPRFAGICGCGHPEESHVRGGPCRVPECRCDAFRPVPVIAGGGGAGDARLSLALARAREGGTLAAAAV